MKKILLTICSTAICAAAFAQLPTFGVKGGLNLAKFTLSADANGASVSLNSKTLTTFNAGVFADFKLPLTHFSIQPSLNYTGKGGNLTEGDSESGASLVVKEKLYYLQLPIDLVYHIPVIVGDVYLGAGPYAARGLSGKVTGNLDDGQGNVQNESTDVHFGNGDNDDVAPMQYGVNFMAGFKLKSGLLINVNYDLGLSNDIPSSQSSDGKSKSKVLGISLGYAIK
jgi:hypothetical protein